MEEGCGRGGGDQERERGWAWTRLALTPLQPSNVPAQSKCSGKISGMEGNSCHFPEAGQGGQ